AYQEFAATGVGEIISTRLEPGANPIKEALRRGSILLVIRMGNMDQEAPNTPPIDTPGPHGPHGAPPMLPPSGLPPVAPGMGRPARGPARWPLHAGRRPRRAPGGRMMGPGGPAPTLVRGGSPAGMPMAPMPGMPPAGMQGPVPPAPPGPHSRAAENGAVQL